MPRRVVTSDITSQFLFGYTGPLLLATTLALSACGGSSSSDRTPEGEPFTLRVLHVNDHHSHVEPNSVTLNLAGEPTAVAMGGFARLATQIDMLKSKDSIPTVTLHAGDAVTGTLYYTAYQGESDAAVMNQICFDAFALGNHEFDGGDGGLVTFLDFLNTGSCGTPVLAANVIPQEGTPLLPSAGNAYLQPYTVLERDGQRIGVIGIDIAGKTQRSSSPLPTTRFLDEVETAQQYIDELEAEGINKIILLTHYQYVNDVAMAGQLSGVDIIVGGDSHTLLGSAYEELGLAPGGEYPTVVQDKNGNTVCVVQAWEYANVVGELNVSFDGRGNVTNCGGVPHLLIGDNFARDGEALEGAALAEVVNIIAARDDVSIVEEDAAMQSLIADLAEQLDGMKNTVLGQADEDLCLARVPGDNRGAPLCSPADTATHGSHISSVVAEAFLYSSREADISIQNGGGVRTNIPAGEITLGAAYTLLPFANTLTNLTMSGAEIHQVLEEAVDSARDPSSDGSYPYAAGLRFKVDMTREMGQRVYDLEYRGRDATASWEVLDRQAMFTVVSNSFTAQGRDGYLTFGLVSEDGRAVDTRLDYAQSFADYVSEVGVISRPLPGDYSTQSFIGLPR